MIGKFAKLVACGLFGLLLLAAGTFGAVYGLMHRDTPASISVAENVLEALSKRWQFDDIAQEFAPVVLANIDSRTAQRAIEPFRGMGPLKRVRDAKMSDYYVGFTGIDGFYRRATLTVVAEFENGEAQITISLVTADGVAKVQHLNLKALRMPPTEARRSIA
ncbi:MAG: hypothetical protein AB7U75_01440 [Hyphomicrobiaceae bacterium]